MKFIDIRGARTHNLCDLDLRLPREKLIVFTGLSGSGKSSLAFDTIYAEGQRRYVESLSAYARKTVGFGMFETLAILGCQRTLARIDAALDRLGASTG